MRKLIVRFIAFLLIVGGLTTSFLIAKPKELKADTPSLYYWDLDTSQENYMTIILYMRDTDSLVSNSVRLLVLGLTHTFQWGSFWSNDIQFLRNTDLDYDDWDAYIYNYNYNSSVEAQGTPLLLYFDSSTLEGEQTRFSGSYGFVYYNTFKHYYDDGYDDGYQDGTNDRNVFWEDYIEETYTSSTGSGYQYIYGLGDDAGYRRGYREGQESLDTMSWFQTITSGVSDVMSIHLLPSITIGGLIFIPFMFMVLGAVLWIWRHR